MFSRNYLPLAVKCGLTGAETKLDVSAKRSEDGKALVLQAVNPTGEPVTAQLRLAGFIARRPAAQVTTLSGPLAGNNTAGQPANILPQHCQWQHGLKDGKSRYTFAPYSVSVLRFE
jgi:alpha-L-arabinofuranosidase